MAFFANIYPVMSIASALVFRVISQLQFEFTFSSDSFNCGRKADFMEIDINRSNRDKTIKPGNVLFFFITH